MNKKVTRASVSFRIDEDPEIAIFEVQADDSSQHIVEFEIPVKEFVKLMFMRHGYIKALCRVYDTFETCDKKREHTSIRVPWAFISYGEAEREVAFNEWLKSEQCESMRNDGFTQFRLSWGSKGDNDPNYFIITAYRWRNLEPNDLEGFSRNFAESFNSETGEFTMLSDAYYKKGRNNGKVN